MQAREGGPWTFALGEGGGAPAGGPGGRPTLRVLFVEDNAGDAQLAQRAARDSGVRSEVLFASSGEEARDLLGLGRSPPQNKRIDLIFLDLHLPGLSGLDLMAELRSHPDLSKVPVVALTGSLAEIEDLGAHGLHVEGYLRKPLTPEQFREICERLEVTQ